MARPTLDLRLAGDPASWPWRTTRRAGISWIPLHPPEGPEVHDAGEDLHRRTGESTVLVRMEPGRAYAAHRHLGVEEVFVLAGGYEDGRGRHLAGDYVRYEPGSAHAPRALGDPDRPVGPDHPACILFAVAREGVELLE